MKVIIQIPCLDEEEQLPRTLAELPRQLDGVDEVEWLVIDDGSTDQTTDTAFLHGVDHVVRFPSNRGLAAAFQAGLDAALKLGADIVVNTDADNQYSAAAIPGLIEPILAGRADVVIGDREVVTIDEFSTSKKALQRLGSWVVRRASGTVVPDATSGFRAYSRRAALELFVVNRFTYTLESLIQAGKRRTAIESVNVGTNARTRESRLFTSIPNYVRRNALTITRVFAAYEPLKFFGAIAGLLFVGSLLSLLPFVLDWLATGDTRGHLQSLLLATGLFLASLQMVAVGVVADLVASSRATTQEVLERVRRLELSIGAEPANPVISRPVAGELEHDRSG